MTPKACRLKDSRTPLSCSRRAAGLARAAACLILFTTVAWDAVGASYGLRPQPVAPGVYVFPGSQDALTPDNGANIANTGFIVGSREVLAVEAGPTRRYGKEMLAAIRSVTDLPVRYAVITHRHPDHSFGLGAFREAGIDVLMHPAEAEGLANEGPALLEFMTALVGEAWTQGTTIEAPSETLTEDRHVDLGDRPVDILVLEGGHSSGDLVVHDRTSGVAFFGDLLFVGRAATVPHADIGVWLMHLDRLESLPWTTGVPGHGPILDDPAGFADTRDWIRFLRSRILEAVLTGESPAEVLDPGVPEPFAGMVEAGPTFGRAVLQLYRRYEAMDPAELDALAQ